MDPSLEITEDKVLVLRADDLKVVRRLRIPAYIRRKRGYFAFLFTLPPLLFYLWQHLDLFLYILPAIYLPGLILFFLIPTVHEFIQRLSSQYVKLELYEAGDMVLIASKGHETIAVEKASISLQTIKNPQQYNVFKGYMLRLQAADYDLALDYQAADSFVESTERKIRQALKLPKQ